MKHLIYSVLCVTITVILSVACSKRESLTYVEHYIGGYYNTEGIELKFETYGGPTIYVRANGRVDKVEYEALCIKHGDVGYNRKTTQWAMPHFSNVDFVSISFTSDVDWDEQHPAGAELGDIMIVEFMSPMKYIRSGYKDTYGRTETHETYNPMHEFHILASELTPEDMVLMGDGRLGLAKIHYMSSPATEPYHITVTLTADDGRVFSDTVRVSWE